MLFYYALIVLCIPAVFASLRGATNQTRETYDRRFLGNLVVNSFTSPETSRISEYFVTQSKGSAWKGNCNFAIWTVQHQNAKVVVDLGVDHGFSTACFAAASEDVKVIAVDLFVKDECAQDKQVDDSLVNLGLRDRVEIIVATFDQAFVPIKQRFRLNNMQVDVLHIDGTHAMPDVMYDYQDWVQLLAPNGVVLFHDIKFTHVEYFFPSLPGHHWGLGSRADSLGVLTNSTDLFNSIVTKWEGSPIEPKPYDKVAHPYNTKRLYSPHHCKGSGTGGAVKRGERRTTPCFQRDCLAAEHLSEIPYPPSVSKKK